MRPISEDDAAEYRHEELMDRERHRLSRMGQRVRPAAPEECAKCKGTGFAPLIDHDAKTWRTVPVECPRCLGTGVQP